MKTAYVVLGMHRSGTSSMAGALALLGAKPPRTLMGPADDNPKGFWESIAITELNDRILSDGASVWHDWNGFVVSNPADYHEAASQVLAQEFGGADTIVLKDPRICRFFGFWRETLLGEGYTPVVVAPVRSPDEVAASLCKRNGMSRAHAIRLWLRHVLDAEYSSRTTQRHYIAWPDFLNNWRNDVHHMNVYGAGLSAIDAQMEDRMEAFLSSDMHHHKGVTQPNPPAIANDVYETLMAMARHRDHPDLSNRMDRLRRTFNVSCALFEDANPSL